MGVAIRRRIRTHRRVSSTTRSGNFPFYIALASIVLTGVLLGSIWEAYARYTHNEYAGYFVLQYLNRYEYTSFASLFGAVLWPSMLTLVFLFYNGFSCIGFPLILMVPLLKGFSIGSISGYLYSTHGFHGMAAVLILFFLPEMLQVWAVLILSKASAAASFGLLLTHFAGQPVNEAFRLGQMAQRLAKSIVLVVLACALESTLSIIFAPILLG